MAGAVPRVDRARVLAYRIAAQELVRPPSGPAGPAVPDLRVPDLRVPDLRVLDLGVRDTPYGSARLALAARTVAVAGGAAGAEGATGAEGAGMLLAWAARGAPHLLRRADAHRMARALWPLSDADATARINTPAIAEGARLGRAAFSLAARAMHEVVREPMAKGEVSTQVSARVAAGLTYRCRACRATHISGALFQQVGLAAGVEVEPVGQGTRLRPIEGWPGVPDSAAGTADLVADYLRLLGPAGPGEVARFLGTAASHLRPAWPGEAGSGGTGPGGTGSPAAELIEVAVDGRPAWLPEDRIDLLRCAPAPRLVRLLPPGDPYLAARDRDLLVPDRDRQKALWRPIGAPGALLVDGEIAGTWRGRLRGRHTLEVEVTGFGPIPGRAWAGVEAAVAAEADRVAAVRGAREVRVYWTGG